MNKRYLTTVKDAYNSAEKIINEVEELNYDITGIFVEHSREYSNETISAVISTNLNHDIIGLYAPNDFDWLDPYMVYNALLIKYSNKIEGLNNIFSKNLLSLDSFDNIASLTSLYGISINLYDIDTRKNIMLYLLRKISSDTNKNKSLFISNAEILKELKNLNGEVPQLLETITEKEELALGFPLMNNEAFGITLVSISKLDIPIKDNSIENTLITAIDDYKSEKIIIDYTNLVSEEFVINRIKNI